MKQLCVKATTLVVAMTGVLLLQGCSPEVGTPEWCDDMKDKPTGEWTANEVSEFTRSCLITRAE
ncbi:DUF3012 domain-containing protein [Marinomonas ostreistagni]|uniref:DUF3012 domain-containing protein n=1 Tax=Marinomonas ostreistagni TaxID=359209 RepID=UPI00194E8C77|nr:DUF3012 domain-containing protein [Marinomonas ostreistagni]MBM6551166.1 DUF3012 domain-containing protein [Marinomonas ostreistagni]